MTGCGRGGGQSSGRKAKTVSGRFSRRDTARCGGERPFRGARALGCLTGKTRKGRPCAGGQSRVRRQEQETSSGSPGAGEGGSPPRLEFGLGRRPQTPGLRALRLPLRPSPPRGGHRGATELRGPAGPGGVPGSLPCTHLSSLRGAQPPKATPTPRPRGSRARPDSRRALFCSEPRRGQAPG